MLTKNEYKTQFDGPSYEIPHLDRLRSINYNFDHLLRKGEVKNFELKI